MSNKFSHEELLGAKFLSQSHSYKGNHRQSDKFNSWAAHKKTSQKTNPRPTSTRQLSMPTSKFNRKGNLLSLSKRKYKSSKIRRTQPRSSGPFSVLLQSIFRLTIFGVGLGAILGTVLANLDLTKPLFPKISFQKQAAPSLQITEAQINSQPQLPSEQLSTSLSLNKKLTPLEQKFVELKAKYPQLEPGAFFVDVDNGSYVDFNSSTSFSAASTIKIPVLIAFFQDVDAGKIYLDEKLTMEKELIGSGSGSMQYQKPGTQFSAIEIAKKMIVISDNTATNMLIHRLGGARALNKRFQQWGLEVTTIRNPLPDLQGTNTTSPKDLAYLLARINNGELLSLRSRDRLLDIMQKTKTKTLLPQGLEKEAIIAHKTGDIGSVLGDAGIVDMPTGKRYIGAVLVKRPHNDYRARTLIQEISQTAYQHFKWYLPHPPLQKKS